MSSCGAAGAGLEELPQPASATAAPASAAAASKIGLLALGIFDRLEAAGRWSQGRLWAGNGFSVVTATRPRQPRLRVGKAGGTVDASPRRPPVRFRRLPHAMLPNRSIPNAAAIPVLIYPDVRAAVNWLTEAFGFVERLQIGEDHRSQMNVGEGGAVIIADVRYDRVPPRQGEVTHSVLVRVEDAREHCEQARAHGAKILDEPTDHVYGERQYNAEDPWGHQWSFSQTFADVAPADWGGILRD
jgi:uncharacterized glyoxalase superfamily protein PhnB